MDYQNNTQISFFTKNGLLEQKQAKTNDKNQRFGIIMTLLSLR